MAGKITTQRRQAEAEQNEGNPEGIDNIPSSIFDALREHPLAPQPEGPKAKDPDEDGNTRIADLLVQMAELKSQIAQVQQTNTALMTPVPVQTEVKEPGELSFDGLPDPVLDQAGFAKALAGRIQAQATQQKAYENNQQQQNQSRQGQLDELWSDFAERYGDYADAPTKRLEFITKAVTDRARARGVDLSRYMFGSRDRFMSDVAAEYDDVFGSPTGGDEEGEEPARRGPGRPRNKERVARKHLGSDDEANRTGGIFGGQESGGSPARGQNDTVKGDMVKDLHDLQRKSGFF